MMFCFLRSHWPGCGMNPRILIRSLETSYFQRSPLDSTLGNELVLLGSQGDWLQTVLQVFANPQPPSQFHAESTVVGQGSTLTALALPTQRRAALQALIPIFKWLRQEEYEF